ncbi:MAG: hypothetical protein HPY67_07925 [Syntrophaceae bacterium]|nr:hypothetical protein [Syntrophaceae bacterium]
MRTGIEQLVRELEDLHRGGRAVDELAACGESAVGPLRDYLLNGPPSHIFQPRQWAVQALARLGAWPVLLEYLEMPRSIPDPVTRFGEEAVENTAARALAARQTEEVYRVLLRLAGRRFLPGVIEALGSFRRPETAPLFVAALGDDLCRAPAEQALRQLGPAAIPALRRASRRVRGSRTAETPTDTLRRTCALRLLAELKRRQGGR